LPQPATGGGYQFPHDLGIGAVDPDVKELQIFLNAHGAQIAPEGPGSPGKEVDVFGPSTQAALTKFQEAHKAEVLTPAGITKATGFFGSTTRNYVNKSMRPRFDPHNVAFSTTWSAIRIASGFSGLQERLK
jgi:peptidoglycan hydrolase-like protein with peptidoglycan-binding domain